MAEPQPEHRDPSPVAAAAPVAMLDSGVGGLSVARAFQHYLPEVPILYLGDPANFPYGRRSMDQVRGAVYSMLETLSMAGGGSRSGQLVILACNTASAAALPEARSHFPFTILSLIDGGLKQTQPFAVQGATVGIIATEATVASGVYERGLRAAAPDVKVLSHAAPKLVEFVEHDLGSASEAEIDERLRAELSAFDGKRLDCLVLGCSHFGHLRQPIARMLPSTVIVDPAFGLAEEAFAILRNNGRHPALLTQKAAPVRIYARGPSEKLAHRARQLLGGSMTQVRPLNAMLEDETGLRQ